ncbi:TonB-dependent receptor [Sphingomonas sp. SRS2]|uniref:TonB-dependent receptor n=1 Tax=Sphingomonas sp. SRS2 TaxID=133190 RepID=UPI001364BC53|nr:TonB-dependent receptor [Sphingomonas sp. SRS2]
MDASSVDTRNDALAEIVVTAQRKAERLQEVPISVNVVSGSQLAARGAGSSIDLVSLVPALQFTTSGGGGTPFLRGVGTTNGDPNVEPSVATYIDGVYIANNYVNVTALGDVERIEVLKGPQGTLFGRNATGGVIQVITRDPTPVPAIEASVGYGNYDRIFGAVYATTAITDRLSGNVSVQASNQREGWGRNVVSGGETYKAKDLSIRGKLLWDLSDDLVVRLAGDYAYVKSGTGDFRLPSGGIGFDGVAFPSNRYDTRGDVLIEGLGEPFVQTEQYGGSLRIDYTTDFGQFVNITAYRESSGVAVADPDMTPIHVQEIKWPVRQHNLSQELQYISPTSWPVSVTAGIYYFDNKAGYANALIGGLALSPNFDQFVTVGFTSSQRSRSLAGYMQGDATILPKTKLTLGIRYTHERDKADVSFLGFPIPTPKIGYDKPTWRMAIDHAFTRDIHAYLSYNRGVKAGGFDLVDFSGVSTGFDPETLDAYEAGIKTELFGNRLRFNAAYFYYKYRDIQLQVLPVGSVSIAQTINAARARIHGFDVDFAFVPFRNFRINGGFAYVDGKYLKFDNLVPSCPISPLIPAPAPGFPNGNPTVRTPKYSANLSASYEIESSVGTFSMTASGSYNGAYSFSPDNRFRQDDYVLMNLSLGWAPLERDFGVTAFVRNVTNARYYSAQVPSSFGPFTSYAAPRTYGVSVRAKFGG